jgi:hypothetical protein
VCHGVIAGEGVAKGVQALTSFLDGHACGVEGVDGALYHSYKQRRTEVPTKKSSRAELLSEPLLNYKQEDAGQNSPWVVATTDKSRWCMLFFRFFFVFFCFFFFCVLKMS